jgi:hypothetical protein
LDLNEWVSFEKPGTYQLRVISRRASASRASDSPYGSTIEVKSNPVELHVTPADLRWQQAQLRQIREALERDTPSGGDVRNDPKLGALGGPCATSGPKK